MRTKLITVIALAAALAGAVLLAPAGRPGNGAKQHQHDSRITGGQPQPVHGAGSHDWQQPGGIPYQ